MVKGVSSAHHEEVGGHLASSASIPCPTRPGPRVRCQQTPLHTEFDASKLKGAEFKIGKHTVRSIVNFKRLKSISEEAWDKISEAEQLKQRALLEEF